MTDRCREDRLLSQCNCDRLPLNGETLRFGEVQVFEPTSWFLANNPAPSRLANFFPSTISRDDNDRIHSAPMLIKTSREIYLMIWSIRGSAKVFSLI